MSLLSGIKFTAREDRKRKEIYTSVGGNVSKRKVKQHKKHKKKEKDNSPKKDEERNESSSNEDEDGEDEQSHNIPAVYLEKSTDKQITRMGWMLKSGDTSVNVSETSKSRASSKSSEDFHNYLSKLNEGKEDNRRDAKSCQESGETELIETVSHEATIPTNLSIAARIKAKLKQNSTNGISSEDKIIKEIQTGKRSSVEIYSNFQDIAVTMARSSNHSISTTSQSNSPRPTSDINKSKKMRKTSSNGAYSGDLENSSLKELMAFERLGGEDIDENYKENILRLGEKYKGTELGRSGIFGSGDPTGLDEEDAIDFSMFQRRDDFLNRAQREQREVNRAKNEMKQKRRLQSNCIYCVESSQFLAVSHLVISTAAHTQLRLKRDLQALAPLHCEILPLDHLPSSLAGDETVRLELERFKGCLRAMFRQLNKIAIFTEVAVRFNNKPHAHIDVIGLDPSLVEELKMYFKEALMSCDEEWATHKRIINLSDDKPLSRSIHPKFPYVAIEWDGGGFAHVVENDRQFKPSFCSEVISGMLEQAEEEGDGKQQFSSVGRGDRGSNSHHPETLRKTEIEKLLSFKKDWEQYDWTQYVT